MINENTGQSENYVSISFVILTLPLELTPFWNGENTFWKSADDAVKDWTKFNYDYPEFIDMKTKTKEERRSAVLDTVVDLYGPSSSRTSAGKATAPVAIGGRLLPNLTPSPESNITDWFVRIRTGRFALHQSYTVLIFLGQPPIGKHEWRSSPQLLGIHGVLVSSRASMCRNCLTQQDNIDEGVVHITERLESLGLLSQPENVLERFLRSNLHWRILKVSSFSMTEEMSASNQ